MSLINKICETCRYHSNSNAAFPCVDCASRDKWEVAEDIRVSTKKLMEIEVELQKANAEIERLSELVGCGCGICLAHSNMVCPKMPKPDHEMPDIQESEDWDAGDFEDAKKTTD